jgi:hypothetical protein
MNRKVPVPFLGEGTVATPSPYPTPRGNVCSSKALGLIHLAADSDRNLLRM